MRVTTVIALTVLVGFVGCNRRAAPATPAAPPPPVSTAPEAPPPPPPPAVADPAPVPAAAAGLTEDEIFAGKTVDELNAERPLADTLFDYDQFTIRGDAGALLQRNAEWLRRWPSTRITIEGHGDSRGTSEYNLALGERRAHAAREYLASLGIDPQRLVVVSKGEDSPLCVEENEDCWQRNRRAYFIITAK